MVFVGIDRAEAHHDVCVVDESGKVLAKRRVADSLEGVSQLHALLAEHVASPEEVVVAIETDRGLMVSAPLAAGYQLYAINPLAASRYRERHGSPAPGPLVAIRPCGGPQVRLRRLCRQTH